MTTTSAVEPSGRSGVSPAITAVVGDVARPSAPYPLNGDLSHLPGESGIVAGVRNLAGWLARGVDHLTDHRKKHGPIFRTQFLNLPVVCVYDPELVAKIAKNDEQIWSAALAWHLFFDTIDPTSRRSDSLVTLDFEVHREARKLFQPAFSGGAVTGYVESAVPQIEDAIARWVSAGRVEFKPALRRLLAEVSTRIFIGVEDPAEIAAFDDAMKDFWGAPMAIAKNPWISPKWRRAMRGHRFLRETLRTKVEARRTSTGTDLFTRLCQADRSEGSFDDDAIVRLFIGLMAAAFDTTSLGLSSTAYLLAKHPDWQERLRKEAVAMGPRFIAAEARSMEETDWVWKETLRLYPVTSNLPRQALRDVELGGYRIGAGTLVQAMTGPLSRDPAWWTAPDVFDPERFSEARAEDRKHKGAYLPFGAGAHACIGMHLSNLEAKAVCHALLTRCRFSLEKDETAGHEYTPLGSVKSNVVLRLEKL